jgi:tetratricopeptide (TPR) repeat protein
VLVGVIGIALVASSSGEPRFAPTVTTATPAAGRPTTAADEREVLVPAGELAAVDASRAGVAAYTGGDLTTAIAQFTAAVEADPDNADALNNLGQVLVKAGRAREAIAYFDRAIAVSDAVWAYHFNRARAYDELKEWRQAVAGYTDAARLFPDDYVTQFNLAKARQADGDMTGAVQGYARAIELAPEQADFHLWYGQALDLSGRLADAAAAYRRYLELEPHAARAEKVKARLAQLSNGADGTPLKAS